MYLGIGYSFGVRTDVCEDETCIRQLLTGSEEVSAGTLQSDRQADIGVLVIIVVFVHFALARVLLLLVDICY